MHEYSCFLNSQPLFEHAILIENTKFIRTNAIQILSRFKSTFDLDKICIQSEYNLDKVLIKGHGHPLDTFKHHLVLLNYSSRKAKNTKTLNFKSKYCKVASINTVYGM